MNDIDQLYEKFGKSRIEKYEELLRYATEVLELGWKSKCEWEFDEQVRLVIGFRFNDGLVMHKDLLVGHEPENVDETDK